MMDGMRSSGGIQFVPQIAAVQQIVYLDFDGESTSYKGEILALDNVEVADSQLSAERIAAIVSALNEKYAAQNVRFVTQRPENIQYSTICIGRTEAFSPYGDFAGIAETIDQGNLNKSDNAFVNLDSSASDTSIIATIAHETDHLLGTLNHGGEGLAAYAAEIKISSGVTSIGLTINNGDVMTVLSSGYVNNITVQRGVLEVSSGGMANNAKVSSGGSMCIYTGGSANNAEVNPYGVLHVFSGGIAENTKVQVYYSSRGSMYISDGGVGKNTTVSGGELHILSGGTANGLNVSYGGKAWVSSGGFASDAQINGGVLYVLSGGSADGVSGGYSGTVIISEGGTATNIVVVNSGMSLTVLSGGAADQITVDSLGRLYVSSGGTATNVLWTPGVGHVSAAYGAVVSFTSSYSGVYVASDGELRTHTSETTGTILFGSGSAYVFSNGTMNDTRVSGGSLYVYESGVLNGTEALYSSYIRISSGGVVNDTTVNDGGNLYVSAGASADGVTVNNDALVYIASGGTATNVIWTPCVGKVSAADGAHVTYASQYTEIYYRVSTGAAVSSARVATNITLGYNGIMYVMGGGSALSTRVNTSGSMIISSGGTATDTVVNGLLQVSNGGIASDTTVDCEMRVYSGGVASITTIKGGAGMYISSGGSANGVTVSAGRNLYVYSGGVADNVAVKPSGAVFVYGGGTVNSMTLSGTAASRTEMTLFGIASQATVGADATMYVSSGGMVAETTVNSKGTLRVSSGAVVSGNVALGGQMNIENGVVFSRAAVNFRLDLKAVYDAAAINIMTGALAGVDFRVTVAANQQVGSYVLVGSGVTDFSKSITVSNGTSELGSLTVGGERIQAGDYFYSIAVDSGKLNFVVEITQLDDPVVTANITTPTNGDVILSVTFDPRSENNQYRVAGGQWQNLTETSVTVSQNGIYEFRSENVDGTYAETTFTVDNIDKIAPEITINRVKEGNEVFLTASSSEESTIMYSFDNVSWMEYSETVSVFFNGTVYFKSTDAAGNTGEKSVVISDIDQHGPAVQPNITSWTNGNVVLVVMATPGAVRKQYSFDNETWYDDRPDSLVIAENGTVYFRDFDGDGVVSEVSSYTVSNIDRVAPEAPDSVEFVTPGSILTLDWNDAADAGNSGIEGYYYRFGLSSVLNGEGTYVEASQAQIGDLREGTWYFQIQSVDAAGNKSDWSQVFSTYVDKAPVITLTTNSEITVGSTLLRAETDDGSPIMFSSDGVSYTLYTGDISITENGTWYFKSTDPAGNTANKSITFNNIDSSVASSPVVITNATGATQNNVTVTINYTGNAEHKQISFDGVFWQTYRNPIVFRENSTIYYREIDFLGNRSEVGSYTVDCIDRSAPELPGTISFTEEGESLILSWEAVADTGLAGYNVRYGASEQLRGEGVFTESCNLNMSELEAGVWYFQIQSIDIAGNKSAWSAVSSFEITGNDLPPEVTYDAPSGLRSDSEGLRWDAVNGVSGYVVECSADGFKSAVSFTTASSALASGFFPAETVQWRVRCIESQEWAYGEELVSDDNAAPKELYSSADMVEDIFFARANGTWEKGFEAQHQGDGSWAGTLESVVLEGKNRNADIFIGSGDAATLILTDSDNGDALFVDDIFTALGDRARISRIDEIRAGAGDDVVDMTSMRYSYEGTAIKVSGGIGNDTIWGGAESNTLFGDAGNDRLVGASGDDLIAGGIGNDSMHGGGGDDIFTFCTNWGVDSVVQLENGSVTLWFENGSEENWNADAMIYSDGVNSVTVTGCTNVTLRFGNTAELGVAEAFEEESCRKVFEEKGFIA